MTTEEIITMLEEKQNYLYTTDSVKEPMLKYADALVEFTCGSCHILAYEMIKLLPKYYSLGLLEDHCFIICGDARCYDITGGMWTEDLWEEWANDWESDIEMYDIEDLEEFVEVANDMYIEDITPTVDNWTMRNAQYWAKKMVKAIEAGATEDLKEATIKYKYRSSKINFDKIVEKHLHKEELMLV